MRPNRRVPLVWPRSCLEVKLSGTELVLAAQAGALRRVVNLLKRSKDRYGFDHEKLDAWGTDIEATCAEALVSKATGYAAIGALPGRDDGRDVGPCGVRWTPREDGCLILHPQDADDTVFYLVVGRVPNQRIVGHIKGSAGKDPGFWREYTGRPAFFVPQDRLAKL